MSRFERWLVRRIALRALTTGSSYLQLTNFFCEVRAVLKQVYYEDNNATLQSFVHEAVAEAFGSKNVLTPSERSEWANTCARLKATESALKAVTAERNELIIKAAAAEKAA